MSHSPASPDTTLDLLPIRRALLSVFDKAGLLGLVEALHASGVELYSTGGTEAFIRKNNIPVRSVSELTNFPEMMDGRVKTLHPMVHGGLLFRRDLVEHRNQAEEHDILSIDLLVANLYPFEQTVATGAPEAEVIEQIDIGGPAMLRSAAKNFAGVALLTSPLQYTEFIDNLSQTSGSTSLAFRKRLATEAFRQVADYDEAIATYFERVDEAEMTPSTFALHLPLAMPLRYGENPQQNAALYGVEFGSIFQKLWGKELSYNNILDLSAAASLIAEFHDSDRPVAAIIKHTNPCGVAEGETIEQAFDLAFKTDPESPFGGIIAINRPMTRALAVRVNEFFSEVIIAPSFEPEAEEVLRKKKDRRLLVADFARLAKNLSGKEVRSVPGGLLVQDRDPITSLNEIESVTSRKLSDEEKRGLRFAWKIVKHVKSNAIVYCGLENGLAVTRGIGAGQTSRVDSSRLAVQRAKNHGNTLENSLVASDAFFPFADGLIEAANAGAIAAIQPGGSIRDQEVIEAAEAHNVSLVMTGVRHFRH